MKKILKKFLANYFSYSEILKVLIFVKYIFDDLKYYKIDKSDIKETDIVKSLQKHSFCKFDGKHIFLTKNLAEVEKFAGEAYRSEIKIPERKRRVILDSQQLLLRSFIVDMINSFELKNICDSYFDTKYLLRTIEVWWGRPNFEASGYRKFHIDRNHFKALYFDLNLIDMDTGSGAVEVVSKPDSERICKKYGLWGGQFVEHDSTLEKEILKSKIFNGTGKKGTITCYDAMKLLHRGGHCIDSERLILHLTFSEEICWRKESRAADKSLSELSLG